MKSGKVGKAITHVTLLAFAITASGCYGSFNLLRTVYRFNGSIKAHPDPKVNGVIKSVVMVVLAIIPVYGLSTWADALVLNSIEFWTGKNPLPLDEKPKGRALYQGDHRYVQTFSSTTSGKEMRIEHYQKGQLLSTLVMRQDENSPTVTGELHWRDGRRETYQITYAGGEDYIISRTDTAGKQSQRIASLAEARSTESRVENLLASPLVRSGPSSIVLQ